MQESAHQKHATGMLAGVILGSIAVATCTAVRAIIRQTKAATADITARQDQMESTLTDIARVLPVELDKRYWRGYAGVSRDGKAATGTDDTTPTAVPTPLALVRQQARN